MPQGVARAAKASAEAASRRAQQAAYGEKRSPEQPPDRMRINAARSNALPRTASERLAKERAAEQVAESEAAGVVQGGSGGIGANFAASNGRTAPTRQPQKKRSRGEEVRRL